MPTRTRGERGSIKGQGVRPGGAIAPFFLWGRGEGLPGAVMGAEQGVIRGGGVGFVKGVGHPHLDEGGYICFSRTGRFFAI
jgi:hypothetical protein